jgi:hypothetical protein
MTKMQASHAPPAQIPNRWQKYLVTLNGTIINPATNINKQYD